MDERGIDHDAVGVVDAQLALERDGAMHLAVHLPSHVERHGRHLVERTVPIADDQPGLLFDLTRQAGHDRRVGRVDHPPGRAPVVRPVAAPVAHQEQAAVAFDHGTRDGHAVRIRARHAASVARPRYHPRVPADFDTGPGPSRGAFFLAYAGVVLAGVLGAVIGYGWGELGCTGNCDSDAAIAAIVGAVIASIGTGIVAVLVLRAMAEWRRPR